MTSGSASQRSIQLSYGCVTPVAARFTAKNYRVHTISLS